jgi:hypothetical protein
VNRRRVSADHARVAWCEDGGVEGEPEIVVTVTLEADGTTGLSLSPTEHPVEALRKAAALLDRYAASIESENEPVRCGTRGSSPTGVRATPDGRWELIPCGHGMETSR